jgi:hypothetical protein
MIMTKQEEQKLRKIINSLLPLRELGKYLKELKKIRRKIAYNVWRVRRNQNDSARTNR